MTVLLCPDVTYLDERRLKSLHPRSLYHKFQQILQTHGASLCLVETHGAAVECAETHVWLENSEAEGSAVGGGAVQWGQCGGVVGAVLKLMICGEPGAVGVSADRRWCGEALC